MSQDIFKTLNSKSGNLKKSSDTVNVQKLKQNNFIKVLFPLLKTKTSEFEFQSKKNQGHHQKSFIENLVLWIEAV